MVEAPVRGTVVTPEQLRALHPCPEPETLPAHLRQSGFNLPDFLARLDIPYERDQHEGGERYKLAHCPFNPEHGKGDAAIFQRPNGALGFKCLHNACADKRWQDVRALVDGPRETGVRPKKSIIDNWPKPKPIRASLYPVPAFEPDVLLPDALRDWVMDEADRMPSPPDFVAGSRLGDPGSGYRGKMRYPAQVPG